jgi:hypothetical protein
MISVPNLTFNSSGYAELKGHKVQLSGYLVLRKYKAFLCNFFIYHHGDDAVAEKWNESLNL